MRKTSAVLATLSLAVLALTGCTAAPTFDGAACDRSGGSSGLADAVTVDGDLGAKPDVSIFSPLHLEKSAFTDVIVGDGRAVESARQPMLLELSLYSGDSGEFVTETTYDPSATQVSTIANWSAQFPGLSDALECATGGSRIVSALTPDDAPGAQEAFGLDADDNMVFVIDVLDVFLPKAEGALQFNDARGMPTVVRAPDGTPGVIIPDTAAPTSQAVQTLIAGDGEKLVEGQTPVVNFTALNWDDKKIVRTTWGDAVSLDLPQIAPPIAEALIGQTVGSQVLVVAPKTEQTEAMVFVVDILGAGPVPTP